MNAHRSTRRLAILLAAAILPIAVRAQAAGADGHASLPAKPSVSCEDAREFAHFQRQLRMTEGDSEPLQPPEPRECASSRMDADGGNDAGRDERGTGAPRLVRAVDSLPSLGGA